MEASQLLKEKERERDRDKEKERKSKLNNSAHILNSNNTNNNAHIKQRNNIHSNSSNEAGSPATPSEHVLRLEADIKRLKADLQVIEARQANQFNLRDHHFRFYRLQGSQKLSYGRNCPNTHLANVPFERNYHRFSRTMTLYKPSTLNLCNNTLNMISMSLSLFL